LEEPLVPLELPAKPPAEVPPLELPPGAVPALALPLTATAPPPPVTPLLPELGSPPLPHATSSVTQALHASQREDRSSDFVISTRR
jgi:hypothetical protein